MIRRFLHPECNINGITTHVRLETVFSNAWRWFFVILPRIQAWAIGISFYLPIFFPSPFFHCLGQDIYVGVLFLMSHLSRPTALFLLPVETKSLQDTETNNPLLLQPLDHFIPSCFSFPPSFLVYSFLHFKVSYVHPTFIGVHSIWYFELLQPIILPKSSGEFLVCFSYR